MPEIIRLHGTPDECVDKIKGLLSEIGNVNEFEVYFENQPSKYVDLTCYGKYEGEVHETKRTYSLILKCDESDKEVWIEGATCGYSGAGPSATSEILQMLGVRMNYNTITKDREIKMDNIVNKHNLNFIVSKNDWLNDEEDIVMKVQMEFEAPIDKISAYDSVEIFGQLCPIMTSKYRDKEEYYFREPIKNQEGYSRYRTNNVFYLSNDYVSFDNDKLELMFRSIAKKLKATTINIKIYEIAK